MRAIRRVLATAAVALVVVAWPIGIASAHPLGNFTVNRAAGMQLSPGRLDVDYVVDLAEIPTEQERAAIDMNDDATLAPAELEAWASRTAAALVDGVQVEVDGLPISLRVSCATAVTARGQGGLPVLRLEAGLAGDLPPAGTLTWRDANDADRLGWHEVTARGTRGVALASSTVPSASLSDRLRAYPDELLSDPPDVREARVAYGPGSGDDVFVEPCAGGGIAPMPPAASGGGLAGLLDREATPAVLGFALLLAAGFGAIHALGPGHGKALMAGTLIGAGARVRQAVAVGGAVSVMHTMSVLALGLLVLGLERTFRPEQIYPWLGLASGLVALALGGWLLVRRLGVWSGQGRREALHEDHVHEHAHGDGPGQHRHHVPNGPVLSRRGLLALAVAGGILPSPTALVVLLSAISLGRIGFGLVLIAAFSVGLAASLVVVGLVTIRAGDAIVDRMSSRLGRLIPLVSSGAVVLVGVVLTVRGVVEL